MEGQEGGLRMEIWVFYMLRKRRCTNNNWRGKWQRRKAWRRLYAVRAKEPIRGDYRQGRGWFFLSQGKRTSKRSRPAFQWGGCSHSIGENDFFCKRGHLEAKTVRRELSWPRGHQDKVGGEMQGGGESMASQGVLACERGGWNQTEVAWENEDGFRG